MDKSEIEISTGNVYADIEAENAEEMMIKAKLAMAIKEIINSNGFTQMQAAEMLGLPQPKLSRLLNGHFRGVSEAKMMDCLTRLGCDVHIVINPVHSSDHTGRVEVVQV